MKNLLIILFLFFASSFLNVSFGQETEVNYANKSYYLVDSLDLSQLGEADLKLLDSCLKEYHKNIDIVNQIKVLQVINENCEDYNLYIKYNNFLCSCLNLEIKQTKDAELITKYKKYYTIALNNKGYDQKIKGQIINAIKSYNNALLIAEEIKDLFEIAQTYNNLGSIYLTQKKYLLSKKYYQNSLINFEKLKDKSGISLAYNNIGSIYLKQDSIEQSIEYYKKSLSIDLELKNKDEAAFSYNNIGMAYKKLNNNDLATEYLIKSLKILEQNKNSFELPYLYNNIGLLKFNKGLIKEAKVYALKGMELSKKLGFPNQIESSAHILSKIAKKKGNYKEAFEMYQLEIQMRDSITNEKNYKAVIQQQSNYEYEKKKAEDSIVNREAEKVQLALLEAEKAKTEQKELALKTEKKQKWYLYIGLSLLMLFSGFMYNRFQFIKKQRFLIKEQKKEVEKSHKEIEESHKEITDSINYAERIQRSFLASKKTLDDNLKDYFVFFKPKEAVSGDFYWSTKLEKNHFAFTVADSTGHGVPGAIMSLLNITSLEKSVETETEPHLVLNKTRETIIKRLKNDGTEEGGKDGMDCSLLVLNEDKSQLTFASANNTVIIIRNKELLEYKGDKMPVGRHDKENESFTLQKVKLQKGDVIYALTDGFQDQFGGPKGKKYMIKNLKNKFIEIANTPMEEQRAFLSEEFNNWKGELEQIDDVCIIGVRI